MALPKQVQDQIDEADRIAAEIEAEQKAAENPQLQVVEDEGKAEAEAEEKAEAVSEPADKSLDFEAETPEADEIVTTEEHEQPEPTELGVDPAVQAAEFEHKYKTLQGMYNSEKRANAELTGRVDALEGMLAQLQSLKGSQEEPEPPKGDMGAAVESLLTAEEIADYGPDMIDVVKRAATEAVAGQLAELRRENETLKEVVGSVGQQQEVDVRNKMYSALTDAVPNWKQVNQSSDFLMWLSEEDVYAGVPRKMLLTTAFEQNDSERVIQFFKGFLKENAALQPAANTEETEVANPKRQPQVTLETLASPGLGASGGADNIQETGRMWKESEIAKFYEDARKGIYKGRSDEYKATEVEIQKALTEGRILIGQ